MLLKLLQDEEPSHLVCAFDPRGKTFRYERFPEYKAKRMKAPEDLHVQGELIKRIVEKLGITRVEVEGFEADDVIGTLSSQATALGMKTVILSTHILPEVSATCDRVLIINDARLVASGTTEELVNRAKGADVVTAGIKGPEEAVYQALRQADFVGEFRKIKEDPEGDGAWLTLEIESQSGDIREKLFRLVVEKDWSMRELKLEKMSLEEVFAKLTTS